MKVKVYIAQKMTGRSCREMVLEARAVKRAFERQGLEVWSPVLEEKVQPKDEPLSVLSTEDLIDKWNMDKYEGLHGCHVIYDATGDMYSEGVAIERGIMRWYLWRPVFRRKKPPVIFSIANIEEDAIVATHEQAAKLIKKRWGSRWKWIAWKLPHILFAIPKLLFCQIKSLWL